MIYRYPALARQHLHLTKVYVPKDIALALSNRPALVQKAAEAFYTRDAIQLRVGTMIISSLLERFISLSAGCYPDDPFPARFFRLSHCTDDKDCICTIGRSKISSPENIRSERKRGYSAMALERYRNENREYSRTFTPPAPRITLY